MSSGKALLWYAWFFCIFFFKFMKEIYIINISIIHNYLFRKLKKIHVWHLFGLDSNRVRFVNCNHFLNFFKKQASSVTPDNLSKWVPLTTCVVRFKHCQCSKHDMSYLCKFRFLDIRSTYPIKRPLVSSVVLLIVITTLQKKA